jgi:hypothetical protein
VAAVANGRDVREVRYMLGPESMRKTAGPKGRADCWHYMVAEQSRCARMHAQVTSRRWTEVTASRAPTVLVLEDKDD